MRVNVVIPVIASILILGGVVGVSFDDAYANKLDTSLIFDFLPSSPVVEGIDVLMSATVTTVFTDPHVAINPVSTGSGRIQQGVNGDGSPASACDPVDWINLSDDTPVGGVFSHNFVTDGLGGQTLVFRAMYVTPMMAPHGPGTTNGDCIPLEITTAADPIEVEKTWTFTDYNWDRICTETIIVEDPPGTFTEVCVADRAANINNNGQEDPQDPPNLLPDDDVLADPLPFDDRAGVDKYTAFAQNHKNKFSNTNPGAFYALTTIDVLEDLVLVILRELMY